MLTAWGTCGWMEFFTMRWKSPIPLTYGASSWNTGFGSFLRSKLDPMAIDSSLESVFCSGFGFASTEAMFQKLGLSKRATCTRRSGGQFSLRSLTYHKSLEGWGSQGHAHGRITVHLPLSSSYVPYSPRNPFLGRVVQWMNNLNSRSPESITSLRSDLSSMGHVESHVNQQGPPCKAKYSWVALCLLVVTLKVSRAYLHFQASTQ
ncbi:hypothetical protein VNO78_16322 [Psophocarpus tetragonolobus]|uniref:Uncharacterized protein n=1 Tax=Psophocarpus tetragonolobus TaxID=3891 RepID=A0AAN9SI47_PSOTE